jgi:hypothetical protein
MDAVRSDKGVLKSRSRWMTGAVLVLGICGFFLSQHRAEAMWGQPQVKIVVEDAFANLTEPTL